jgi:hypothetical protein
MNDDLRLLKELRSEIPGPDRVVAESIRRRVLSHAPLRRVQATGSTRARRSRRSLFAGRLVPAIVIATLASGAAAAVIEKALQPSVDLASHFSALTESTLPQAPTEVTAMFAEIQQGIGPARALGNGVYLAADDKTICVVVLHGFGQCHDQSLDHGVWLQGTAISANDSSTAPFDVQLFGVAEDGTSSLVVTLANGDTTTIPIVNNGFRASIRTTASGFGDIRVISAVSADGQTASLNIAGFTPPPTFTK